MAKYLYIQGCIGPVCGGLNEHLCRGYWSGFLCVIVTTGNLDVAVI